MLGKENIVSEYLFKGLNPAQDGTPPSYIQWKDCGTILLLTKTGSMVWFFSLNFSWFEGRWMLSGWEVIVMNWNVKKKPTGSSQKFI